MADKPRLSLDALLQQSGGHVVSPPERVDLDTAIGAAGGRIVLPPPIHVEGVTDPMSVRVTNPPPPTPTITRGRFTGLPGRNVTSAIPELLTEGAMQTGRGVASFARQALYPQGMDAAFNAGSDVLEGAMQMATPLVIGGLIADLPATLFALGVGYVASKAAGKVADLVDLSPAATRFVENFAGAVAASGLTLRRLNQLGLKAAGKIAEKAAEARAAREVQAPAEYIDVTPRQLEADNAPLARPASAGPATRPAPAPLTIATIEPLVDAEGRVLGGDAGPERRVVAQGLPTGVEERRLLPAAPVREDFRTNPDLVKQAEAMQRQADEARVTAPLTIATVEPLEEEALRAVQEPSRKTLDVRQQTGDGKAVGRGDAEYPRPAGARAPQGQEAVIAEAEGPLATLSDEQLHAIVDHPESHEEVAHEAIAELMVRKEQADVQPTLPEQATTMAKEPVEDTRPTRRVGSPSGGGREGMAGLFSEAEPATTGRAETIRPIEFPELVGLARELASTPGVIKRFRSEGKRGEFRGDTGTIRLASDLFTAGQEQQLAATLAHEIGHLVDWLPHRTLKRGNILGRLFSLRSFLKHTFIAPDGSHITNKEIKAELMALSNKWRPWDPATVSPSFAAYRKSAKENFADAMSVLLNNPSLLEKDAPIFYEQFFTALDQKPEVKRAYFDLQELLAGSPEELVARRRAGVQEMFTLGDTKAMDLERLRQAERRMTGRDLWLRMRIQHVDKYTPVIDRVKQLEARGVRINPDDDPRYFLEERNYLGGKLKAFTEQHFLPIYTTLSEHAIDWHTFGEPLLYERIIAGDRSELANPRGIAPAVASDLRNDLLRSLNPEQRRVIRENITAFRTVLNGVAEDAHQAGLYTDDLHTQMQENPAWVSFRVIEHIESNVTSRVYRQVGTLKDITNPADASMLKTLVTLRAIEHQRVKVACFNCLTQYYPADIEQAKEIGSPKGRRPIDPEDQKKQQLVTYYEHGHLRGKYVDPYIADSLINASVGQNWAIISGLRFVNSTLFRPLFTTLNLGFQTSNFARDFLRSWKNQPTMTFARLAQRYLQAVPLARVRAFGLPAHPNAQQRLAHKELLEAQQTALLSVTFNDLIAGREIADTQIEDTLARMGIGGFGSTAPKSQILRPVRAVLDWIRKTGDFIETLPKAAAIYEYRGAGTIAEIPADIRSRIRRTIGSPDFLAGGTYKPITNEVLLFSNAIVQVLRSDLDVATAPATRTGFWWKTAKLNILPKLLAFAVLFGLAVSDDDEADDSPVMTKWREIRRAWRGISEYDMTNYLSIPLGLDEKGNAVYVRLPQDDAGRLIGGLTWKLLRAFRGDREVLDVAMGVLDYTAGQGPSLTPTLQVGTNVAQFAAGRNVYDPFRSRFLFTEDELKAGGWRAAQKFVGYEFQQLGGGILWRFSPGATRPREQTTGQRILDLPVLSNIVGRWIRISNYGEIEHLRETEQKVQQGEARGRLAEREAVMEALRSYLKLPAAERTMGKQQALAHGIVDHLYADKAPRDRAEEYRDVLKKIRMGIQRGGADALTDTVLSATSTAQKVAVLLAAAESMGRAKFSEWMFRATQEQVISSAVRAEVNRALAKPAPAAR